MGSRERMGRREHMGSRREAMHKYDDIIDLPCHVSPNRPHMPMLDRAAQFSPFAALSGYDSAVKEAMRLTEEEIELDEDSREALDQKLAVLMEHLDEQPDVTVTFFCPDEQKEGGSYQTVSGKVRRIDGAARKFIMEDGMTLPMEHIVQMDSEVFSKIHSF